ncbi:hypothetical protein BLI708_07215 [Bifidobacterium imperatoris]|uniref:Uncharacterized protein n=1 Tax=Bifidobacterium imperatoris TaxID=2020965 RepID=A0ABX7RZ39_9BIFI|nr:hypothetical protein [Bifidobacterium imperatoris]QSY57050.1 hypothetical protein BLI708_07215 [Bifidobacterium imperatoris]
MSTFTTNSQPTAAAPLDHIGGFAGNTVTPFDYGSCPCHNAVERSRNLIGVQQAATIMVCERSATASASAHDIVWTGNAANLFRTKLSRIAQASQTLVDDIATTHRLVWG